MQGETISMNIWRRWRSIEKLRLKNQTMKNQWNKYSVGDIRWHLPASQWVWLCGHNKVMIGISVWLIDGFGAQSIRPAAVSQSVWEVFFGIIGFLKTIDFNFRLRFETNFFSQLSVYLVSFCNHFVGWNATLGCWCRWDISGKGWSFSFNGRDRTINYFEVIKRIACCDSPTDLFGENILVWTPPGRPEVKSNVNLVAVGPWPEHKCWYGNKSIIEEPFVKHQKPQHS